MKGSPLENDDFWGDQVNSQPVEEGENRQFSTKFTVFSQKLILGVTLIPRVPLRC